MAQPYGCHMALPYGYIWLCHMALPYGFAIWLCHRALPYGKTIWTRPNIAKNKNSHQDDHQKNHFRLLRTSLGAVSFGSFYFVQNLEGPLLNRSRHGLTKGRHLCFVNRWPCQLRFSGGRARIASWSGGGLKYSYRAASQGLVKMVENAYEMVM